MLDTVPRIIDELRDDVGVIALLGDPARVRGDEAGPGDGRTSYDGPGGAKRFRPFVVVTALNTPRHPRVPIQTALVDVRCYGSTPANASALYMACSDALHGRGPRVHPNGLGIYVSHDNSGGSFAKDPDTKQPYYSFIVELVATTQVVA